MFKGTGSYFVGFQGGYNYLSAVAAFARRRGRHIVSEHARRHGDVLIAGDTHNELRRSGANVRERCATASAHPLDNWLFYPLGLPLRLTTSSPAPRLPARRSAARRCRHRGKSVPGAAPRRCRRRRCRDRADAELGGTARYLYTGCQSTRSVTFPGGVRQSASPRRAIRFVSPRLSARPRRHRSIFSKGPSALDFDRFLFKGQTTFVEQYTPPFRSPYLGPHSPRFEPGPRELRRHVFRRRQTLGRRVLGRSGDHPGFWAQRHRRRCRISERRFRQGRRLGAVYAHSTRLHSSQTIDLGGATQRRRSRKISLPARTRPTGW